MDGNTMICAGEEGYDSSQGDSGGPMTCGTNDMGTNLAYFDKKVFNLQTHCAESSRGAGAALRLGTPGSMHKSPPTSTGLPKTQSEFNCKITAPQ